MYKGKRAAVYQACSTQGTNLNHHIQRSALRRNTLNVQGLKKDQFKNIVVGTLRQKPVFPNKLPDPKCLFNLFVHLMYKTSAPNDIAFWMQVYGS